VSEARCDDVRLALGALALGVLEPAEKRRVREHVAECAACALEAEALTATAGALALVDAEAVQGEPPTPSSDLLPRLLAEVRRARLRRRLAGLAAAAVIAVAAGLGGLALSGPAGDPAAESPAPVASAAGQQQGVALEVDAWDRGWGTAVRARISGVPPGERCSLVAVSADGVREVGATWVVPDNGYEGGGTLTVDGAVGIRSWQVAHYEVVTEAGETLVATSS
jgi:anti-sigma factor RsiW